MLLCIHNLFCSFLSQGGFKSGFIQGASRQALENLPMLAEDDTALGCLLPKATPYPPNSISISRFSKESGSLAQTCLQRGEMTCTDFVSLVQMQAGISCLLCFCGR